MDSKTSALNRLELEAPPRHETICDISDAGSLRIRVAFSATRFLPVLPLHYYAPGTLGDCHVFLRNVIFSSGFCNPATNISVQPYKDNGNLSHKYGVERAILSRNHGDQGTFANGHCLKRDTSFREDGKSKRFTSPSQP